MTSFENFRRSRHSIKSSSRLSNGSREHSFANIQFSANEIAFFYQEDAQALISSDLKITNFSNHSVYFRILTNAAQYYEVIPSQDIIQSGATIGTMFKMKKQKMVLSPTDMYPNNFTKIIDMVKKHLFEVQWAMMSDEQMKRNQLPQLTHRQTFEAKIIDPFVTNSRKKIEEKPNEMSSNSIDNIFLQKEQQKVSNSRKSLSNNFLLDEEHNLIQNRSSLLTAPIIAFVAIFSFLIGFISA